MVDTGAINSIRAIRRHSDLPDSPEIHVRYTPVNVVRDRRRRPNEVGPDELEARAIDPNLFPGATLPERIVYRKLQQMLSGDHKFIFQRAANGGRTHIGGFVIDFLLIDRVPEVALEVLGSFWHQAEDRYTDQERALAVTSEGFRYHEIWDYDIFMSDEHLEAILTPILERRSGFRGVA